MSRKWKKLPTRLRRPLGKLRAVFRRLRIWQRVKRELSGDTPADAAVLNAAIRSCWRTVWNDLHQWQFPMVAKDCTVVADGVGKFRVRAWTDDLFHALPSQEPAVAQAVQARLRPGDVFIDAGANIGFYSILASRIVGPEGKVISVEMMPQTAAILREHARINGCANLQLFENALSDRPGDVVHASAPVGKSGQARLGGAGTDTTVSVTTTTLETILRDIPRVALMKLDVEGVEVTALKGAGSLLHRIEAIIFESWDSGSDASQFLSGQGYRITRLDRRNKIATRPSA